MRRIAELFTGTSLVLEELIRAVADGKGEQLPDTVLAMLQARIGRLPARELAALRAAGVFGPRFWRGGVQALLSPPFSQEEIDHGLETLEQEEFIEKQSDSQFPGETEFIPAPWR